MQFSTRRVFYMYFIKINRKTIDSNIGIAIILQIVLIL